MSNETDKPLAGALRAAKALNGAMARQFCVSPQIAANIIARESGLAELVEAVETANVADCKGSFPMVKMRLEDWQSISAAARRVREG